MIFYGSNKGQVFTLDFVIGLLLIIFALTIVVVFLPRDQFPLREDTSRVAVLMTDGIPENWNSTNVIIPGFLSNNRFNETKINEFASLPQEKQRLLLQLTSNITIRFYQNQTEIALCQTCGTTPASLKELLSISRWAILNSTPTDMEVQLYQ